MDTFLECYALMGWLKAIGDIAVEGLQAGTGFPNFLPSEACDLLLGPIYQTLDIVTV